MTTPNTNTSSRFAMIMAGGAGTRLWPMSRAHQPKQLIRFIQREEGAEPASLLELSAARLEGLVPQDQRYICTGEKHREQIRAALPMFDDEHVIGEPALRDTLNAVGLTAAVLEKRDPEAIFAVLTADHLIEPDQTFRACVEAGFALVEEDGSRLVTFAIKPTYPATGFGYVKRGSAIAADGPARFAVDQFVEKPPLEKATEYVESGDYGWNAGMFVCKARTIMELLAKHHPESEQGLRRVQAAWGTADQARVLGEVYPTLHKTSVDYGIMEPASGDDAVTICGVEMDLRWLDVGSWPAYAETLDADSNGNGTSGLGDVALEDSRDNLVVTSPGHTVALLGCEGLVVVQTPEATLVMPKDKAEQLKALHGKVAEGLR